MEMLPKRKSIEEIKKAIDTNGSRPVIVFADDFEYYLCKYDSCSKIINEYIAHCFLKVWEVPVFPAAIVQIQPEHIPNRVVQNRTQPHHFNKPSFGLLYNDEAIDASNLLIGLKGNYNELRKFVNRKDFIKIALFDLWVANTDRNVNNYNMLIKPSNEGFMITPIDHTDIFDGCRLGQQLAQLTKLDSILSSNLAHVLMYNTKKIAAEANALLDIFPTFVVKCGEFLPKMVESIPDLWCTDKKQLLDQLSSSLITDTHWLADTKENFRELIQDHIR